jgi:hypothetical protein
VTGVDIAEYGMKIGFASVGGWGVVYAQADFAAFGRRFGAELLRQGAQHAIVDAEMCAKGTRDGQGMKPIIDGMCVAGWAGPVHLCPLGAPTNALPHGPNDFAVDVKSFLDTGGGVLPQAYFNSYAEYRPDLCADYWTACGVPADRLNLMVELAVEAGSEKQLRIDGATWVRLLKGAGVGRNFSAYMVQHLLKSDIDGFAPLAATPAPLPNPGGIPEVPPLPVIPDPREVNREIAVLADTWLGEYFGEKPLSRLRIIKRIATSSDAQWNAAREAIKAALDKENA